MLQSKRLRLLRSPPGVLVGQIHKDLCVPLFAYHCGAVTASFDSKLADMGNPQVWKLGRYLSTPKVDTKDKNSRVLQASRVDSPTMTKSTKRIAFCAG